MKQDKIRFGEMVSFEDGDTEVKPKRGSRKRSTRGTNKDKPKGLTDEELSKLDDVLESILSEEDEKDLRVVGRDRSRSNGLTQTQIDELELSIGDGIGCHGFDFENISFVRIPLKDFGIKIVGGRMGFYIGDEKFSLTFDGETVEAIREHLATEGPDAELELEVIRLSNRQNTYTLAVFEE